MHRKATLPESWLTIGQELWFFHNVFLETQVAFGYIGPALL